MIAQLFYIYGGFCATHPWEIIMAMLTVTTCLLSMEKQHPLPKPNYAVEHNADFALTVLIQCIAVIYSCFQFSKLLKMGKYYVLGIASLVTVLLSFLLTSTMINFMYADLSSLKNTLLCFLLVTHLSKAGKLAKFTFASHKNVKENIGTGMARIGPTMTLDTLVEALVIGMGTLSGVNHLEVVSFSLLLSVVVNYAVFMTFYPASLALIMNFHRTDYSCGKNNILEEEEKSNPVVQRVKLIMSIELIIIHFHSRWFYQQNKIHAVNLNKIESVLLYQNISKWMTLSTAHIMVLTIFLALVAKFVLFENEEDDQDIVQQRTDNLVREHREDTKIYQNQETQTECKDKLASEEPPQQLRDLDVCLEIYNSNLDASKLSNEEVMLLVKHKYISMYQIEKAVGDLERGVQIRRNIIGSLTNLPFKNYDYSRIMGACCENVIGYVPVPVGIVGPLHLDGQLIHVPLATTEGCLVASTNRGSRAVLKCGITSKVVGDGMTRGPVVRFPSVVEASAAKSWIEEPENFGIIKSSFDAGSRFARLTRVNVRIVGRLLYMRFVAKTGDAMGMNMVSKGTKLSLKMMESRFSNMEILSLSGNTCTDKKPAAINWIEGRGKSVVCEAIVPGDIVSSVLKTTVGALVELNTVKNLIGSAVAGSIGGFNAHAANLVTAIFIATGQDPAQNVCSSNCMTLMEHWGECGEDLYITCTMPSIEVGTVGGGTGLLAQSACLDILGVKGSHKVVPGENANQLARIVCGTVLAGELSLIAALTSGHLVKSHLKHNRSLVAISDGTNFFSQHR